MEWAILLTLLSGLALVLSVWRWREHTATGEEQVHRLQVQADGLAQQLEPLLQSVDRVLTIAGAARHEGAPHEAAAQRLAALNDVSIVIQSLRILDADGRVHAASHAADGAAVPGDPTCFEQARQRPGATVLHVCAPFRTPAGAWSIDVLRATSTPDGRFDGAVVASLNLDYLAATLPSALYAEDMRAFLLTGSGVVIVSGQAEAYGTGSDLTRGSGNLLVRFLAEGRSAGVLQGRSSIGGERIVAFRHLAGLHTNVPLLVAVSRGTPEVFRDWTLASWLGAAAWLLAAGAGCAALIRTQRLRRVLSDEVTVLNQQRLAELERMELIVGSADLSLWVWHAREERLEVDARWCAMLGCPADDLGRAAASWSARVHPDDWPVIRDATQHRMLREGGVSHFEYRLRHDDGHWVWLMSRGKLVERDASGEPLRFAGTNLDITERKQIEQALRASEESLSTTLQSIGDAVIATDARGRITRMNPAAEGLTGWSAEGALGRPLAEVFRIIDGQTRVPVLDPVALAMAPRDPPGSPHDTILITRDGSERQIADNAAPIRDASGAANGAVLVFSDVTESHRVQQALRDSEAQLRLITDAMPGPVSRHDLQRRFLFANRAHERWLGLAASELLDRTQAEVYGPEAMAVLAPFLQRVEAGEHVEAEASIDSPKRGKVHLQLRLVPDIDDHGAVRGHISVVNDITERHALEEHLRESQKMDSIGTLAGGIAHDFNNVLGAIIGNAELALQQLDGAHAARAHLGQISRASQRARGLVQRILTFSRHHPQQLVSQPLQPLIEETLDLLRSTLPARVELVAEIGEAPLFVNADATQLQQVLMNLGTNAWHALHNGAGRIEVGVAGVALGEDGACWVPGLAAGHYAYLWVRDNGTGMDAATRQRIFEPFFTTKPVGQGTGLGLSVVHGIVKTHLGGITVDTELGHGTTVHVYLPATARPSQVGTLDEAEASVMRGRGQHVMYVDDDEVMALMAGQLLERAGYRVTTCPDAKQALGAFVEDPRAFDMVVTDFNMPDFTGLELAAELARIRPDLPVAISSGFLSDELRAGARRAGIQHLLPKQNSFEELAALVHRVLAEAAARRDKSA